MRGGKLLSPPERAEAWRMRLDGKLSWSAIARRFELGPEGLRRQIDPDYREKRNARSHVAPRHSAEHETAEAWRMRTEGHLSWSAIAAHFRLSREALRRRVDPTYRERRNGYQKAWMRNEARARRMLKRSTVQISAARTRDDDDQDHHHGLAVPCRQSRPGLAAR